MKNKKFKRQLPDWFDERPKQIHSRIDSILKLSHDSECSQYEEKAEQLFCDLSKEISDISVELYGPDLPEPPKIPDNINVINKLKIMSYWCARAHTRQMNWMRDNIPNLNNKELKVAACILENKKDSFKEAVTLLWFHKRQGLLPSFKKY